MSWRASFQPKDFITITLSVVALALSATSWRTSVAGGRHGAVGAQMQLYLSEYVATLDAEPLAFTQCGYARTTPRNRERARAVLGLLVGLVEAMDQAADRRADPWRARFLDLKGPLYDPAWNPASYASSTRVAEQIGALRNGHLSPVDCTTST